MPHGITPFLWFDSQAEEAARFYTSIFPRSRVTRIARYGEGAPRPAGSVMTVAFELDGQPFTALNGGPHFAFSEAISFVVHCTTQDEVDRYWDALSAGGQPQQCGWLKDRFGLSWQVVPTALLDMLQADDAARVRRVTEAMLHMVKLDITVLQQAWVTD
jgi:predicted 3-demethylubiquinone-9 3-methyltransferase (glyoxalase superfamily)